MENTLRRLRYQLRKIVNDLTDRDGDDLTQVMAVAILEAGEGHNDSFYLRRAADRARDYVRADMRARAHERSAGLQRARSRVSGDTLAALEAYRAADPWLSGQIEKWPRMTWHYMTLGACQQSDNGRTTCTRAPAQCRPNQIGAHL